MNKSVEVEIEIDDVLSFIDNCATKSELQIITKRLMHSDSKFGPFLDRGVEGTLVRDEKIELLSLAFEKFTLEQLEEKLGTKFDLL